MVLYVPKIGLVAPVLAGVDETILSEGVGHLGTSSWPNQGGTDVLEAHDVTFFARLDELKAGDTLVLRSACHQWTYQVSTARIVTQGTNIERRHAPTLILVTCWPTNALYFTTQRYVLTAAQVSAEATAEPEPVAATFSVPAANLPAGLSAKDVGVDSLGTPEGTLSEARTLSATLRSSAAALEAATTAMQTFDTGLLAAERGEMSLWAPVGETALFPETRDLTGTAPVWDSHVDLELGGTGSHIASARLHAKIGLGGTRFDLVAQLTVSAGHWEITSWSMKP